MKKKPTKKPKGKKPAQDSAPQEPPAPKLRQVEIPGTERPRIKVIEAAAEEYVQVRDRRMVLTKDEVAKKSELTRLMHEHAAEIGRDADGGLTYRYEDMKVLLKPTDEKLSVKHVNDVEETITVGAPKDESEGD